MTNTRMISALLKFLGHFLLGSFVFLGGLALTFMYYFTSEQVHVVFHQQKVILPVQSVIQRISSRTILI